MTQELNNQAVEKISHRHDFTVISPANERRTLGVVVLTAVMMVLEIIGGTVFGSLALLSDGWHMGTHAIALGITLFAYRYTRRHSNNPRYTFGTGKINVLGGYTSAVVLQIVAILMVVEAVRRLLEPQPIQFSEAIAVAVLGLVVNLFSVAILGVRHNHHDGHEDHHHAHAEHDHQHENQPDGNKHEQSHEHHVTDHNLKAAYLHVLADALTSVLAIIALVAGSFLGWVWLDASMGIVGSLVITRWAIGLLRETGQILLDGQANAEIVEKVRSRLEVDGNTSIADLHIWQLGDQNAAAIISLLCSDPKPVEYYRSLLGDVPGLVHVTIEVNGSDANLVV